MPSAPSTPRPPSPSLLKSQKGDRNGRRGSPRLSIGSHSDAANRSILGPLEESGRDGSSSRAEGRKGGGTAISISSPLSPKATAAQELVASSRQNGAVSANSSPRLPRSAKTSISSAENSPLLAQFQTLHSPHTYSPYTYPDSADIVEIMTRTAGLARGYLYFTTSKASGWASAYCYVEAESGSLLCDREGGKHGTPQCVISDLRSCQAQIAVSSTDGMPRLLLATLSRSVLLQARPLINEDVMEWFAAFLCWSFVQPRGAMNRAIRSVSPFAHPDQDLLTGNSATLSGKTILVSQRGQMDISHDNPATFFGRQVNCVVRNNGELHVSADPRSEPFLRVYIPGFHKYAIQALDSSVFNISHMIAIYPQYRIALPESPELGQPLYLGLANQVLFETWLSVLRSFAGITLYGPPHILEGPASVLSDPFNASRNGVFRIERKLIIRATEANFLDSRPSSNNETKDSVTTMSIESGSSIADYSLNLALDRQLWARTPVLQKTSNPYWRETFEFLGIPPVLQDLSVFVKKHSGHRRQTSQSVYSSITADEYCASIDIPDGTSSKSGGELEDWFPLTNKERRVWGEVSLWLRVEETPVLMAGDYRPLSELVHDFSNNLTTRLATLFGTDLQTLAQVLLDIFQASNSSRQWFMRLIEDDVDSGQRETQSRKKYNLGRRAGTNDSFDSSSEREVILRGMSKSAIAEGALLFRGNSILTKALDIHFKRTGGDYLKEILREAIEEVEAANLDCEVDPNKASAAANLESNWSNLMNTTQHIWDCIKVSAKRCPYDLRFLMRYVRSNVEDRFGGFLQTVSYSSVSAFLFLRFLVPSILNPKLFNLLDHHPPTRVQRTLTLVSKTLQVLANLSTFGIKEPFMQSMNQFLSQNRSEFKSFIDEFCSVPSDPPHLSYQSLAMSTAALSTAQLSPLARELCLTSSYLFDQAHSFAVLVELWLHSAESIDKSELDGDLFRFHHICMGLRQRTQMCLEKAAPAPTPADIDDEEWETLLKTSDSLSSSESFFSLFEEAESPLSLTDNIPLEEDLPEVAKLRLEEREPRSSSQMSRKKLNTLVGGFLRKQK